MHVYAARGVSSLQTGPLVVDGTMYFTTDEGSYAINASTCEEKWKQHRHSDTPSMLLVNRGFAYLNGRLFRGTSDSHVLAMDPADGHVLWDHQRTGNSRASQATFYSGLLNVDNKNESTAEVENRNIVSLRFALLLSHGSRVSLVPTGPPTLT